jgi:hypothetical protein
MDFVFRLMMFAACGFLNALKMPPAFYYGYRKQQPAGNKQYSADGRNRTEDFQAGESEQVEAAGKQYYSAEHADGAPPQYAPVQEPVLVHDRSAQSQCHQSESVINLVVHAGLEGEGIEWAAGETVTQGMSAERAQNYPEQQAAGPRK